MVQFKKLATLNHLGGIQVQRPPNFLPSTSTASPSPKPFFGTEDDDDMDDESLHCQVTEMRRPFTDWPFLLLFVACCAGMVVVALVARSTPAATSTHAALRMRLFMPTDHRGNVCGSSAAGREEDMRHRRQLWYFDPTQMQSLGGTCVSYCPGNGPKGSPYCPPELIAHQAQSAVSMQVHRSSHHTQLSVQPEDKWIQMEMHVQNREKEELEGSGSNIIPEVDVDEDDSGNDANNAGTVPDSTPKNDTAIIDSPIPVDQEKEQKEQKEKEQKEKEQKEQKEKEQKEKEQKEKEQKEKEQKEKEQKEKEEKEKEEKEKEQKEKEKEQKEKEQKEKKLDDTNIRICTAKRSDMPNTVFPEDSSVKLLMGSLQYRPVLNRCIPSLDSSSHGNLPNNVTTMFKDSMTSVFSQLNSLSMRSDEMWGDVVRSWRVIVLSVAVAISLGFLFLALIRFFAAAFVWSALSLVFCSLMVSGVYGIFDSLAEQSSILNKSSYLSRLAPSVILYGSVALIILSILYLFLIFLFLRQVKRAVVIFTEASQAMSAMPQIFLIPVFLLIAFVIFFSQWISVALSLWSSGDFIVREQTTEFSSNKFHRLLLVYHCFGGLWVTQFLLAYMYTTTAGAISTWYWSRAQQQQHQFMYSDGHRKSSAGSTVHLYQPVLRSAIRPILYHAGSLAMGSLLVSMVQILTYIVLRMLRQAERITGDNIIFRVVRWIAVALVSLLNKLVNEVTKHAYIQIAIYGGGFLDSGRNAITLLRKNSSQLVVVDWLGDAVILVGQFAIALTTTYIAHVLCHVNFMVDQGALTVTPLLVLVIVFFVSLVISKVMLTVYETAVDTVLQCFLIDKEFARHSGRGQLYAPPSFCELMDDEKRQAFDVYA